MTTFSERLAAAKSASRPTRTVQVLLDADLSAKREELRAELERARTAAASDQRLAAVNTAEQAVQTKLDELLNESAESLVTLRFSRLPGDKWAEITARCPVRLDAPIDRQYGYNMHAVCRLAAPVSGVRVEGDGEVPLTVTKATEETPAVDEWADLFGTISGHEFGLIIDAIYDLNEYSPAAGITQLKKELATRTA